MATIVPGAHEPAAGSVTCASTLPTATAIPSGRPVSAAAAGVSAGLAAERGDRVGQLVRGEGGEARVERGQVVPGRILLVLEDALVSGGARVAGLGPAQLPDDPVRGLDPPVGELVHLGVFVEDLERLGELPLRGDLPAVAVDPLLVALVRRRVDPVRLRLCGVVLPQLGVGVRPPGKVRKLAERRPGGEYRHAGGRGEVGGHPDHLAGVDPGVPDRGRDHHAQRLGVVAGVLQRPVRRQLAVPGQRTVDHAVRVLTDGGARLGAVADPHHQGAGRQRAEVDAYHVGAVRVTLVSANIHLSALSYVCPDAFLPLAWRLNRGGWPAVGGHDATAATSLAGSQARAVSGPPGQRPGGAALALVMSSGAIRTRRPASIAPDIRSVSVLSACRPTSPKSWRTVVSGGL